MAGKSTNQLVAGTDASYDKKAEVKAFNDSKAGVKGLVESGVTKIPRMFHSGKLNTMENSASDYDSGIPIIDLKDIQNHPDLRAEVIGKIRSACHEWGFFQVINHGIPISILDDMIDGIRRFHEQEAEARKKFYTTDLKKKVLYYSNISLYNDGAANWRDDQAANWRDTFGFAVAPHPPKPEEIPAVCRYWITLVLSFDSSMHMISSHGRSSRYFFMYSRKKIFYPLHYKLCTFYPYILKCCNYKLTYELSEYAL